jgi:UDP-2-acetamido-3-amino-2,3-dideoxy-glucuronate N-acetyltransferase
MTDHTAKMKVGVLGAGAWGKNLIRNFNELGVLDTVCDQDSTILNERKQQYPDIHHTQSYEDIINKRDIEAIVIATPAATHYRLAKQALNAKKHVYVEKPLALSIDEATELIAIAEKYKRVLMVGHILRYHTAVNKLKELIDKGELGKIQYIYSNRLNIGKIRTEENILWR